MNHYNKIAAELVVSSREVLEVRPRSEPAPAHDTEERDDDSDDRWDNAPCTD